MNLWTDGGCCGHNPSPVGLVWAWALVDTDKLIRCDWGKLTVEEIGMPTASNNFAELYAAVRGLESLPYPFEGKWHTDSLTTLRRLSGGSKFNGIPGWLKRRATDLWRKFHYKGVLVAGHPTKNELREGKAKRNGHPVSKWNVLVDELCNRAKEAT